MVWTSLRFTLFRAALKVKTHMYQLAPHRGDIARRRSRDHYARRRADAAPDHERWVGVSGA